MPTAVLKITSGCAEGAVTAIEPEVRRDLTRTHAEIRMDGDSAILSIESSDTSAMRAALNSYLECIVITENIEKITKGTK
ncbi:MAG: hypothetical protein MJZ68_06170 [archaeon]|nr:hypothetical protein [archaeon]